VIHTRIRDVELIRPSDVPDGLWDTFLEAREEYREGQRAGVYAEVSQDPLVADEAEQRTNPRSRSAKLRWARRAGEVAPGIRNHAGT